MTTKENKTLTIYAKKSKGFKNALNRLHKIVNLKEKDDFKKLIFYIFIIYNILENLNKFV